MIYRQLRVTVTPVRWVLWLSIKKLEMYVVKSKGYCKNNNRLSSSTGAPFNRPARSPHAFKYWKSNHWNIPSDLRGIEMYVNWNLINFPRYGIIDKLLIGIIIVISYSVNLVSVIILKHTSLSFPILSWSYFCLLLLVFVSRNIY